ncbi:hypothetical protein BH23PAT2_BH23PAT2_06880 [soil metagenome]|jgi:DNA-binding response OmpR family regulator
MHKIAIIEDDVAISSMYKMKLSGCGYDVKTAFNGAEGLELIKEFKPDLVLLDIRMPVMTGDKMLEKVRESDWGGDLRVIVLTNISRDEAPMSLRLLGIDRYIVKAHHTPSEVVKVVQEICR